MGHVLILPKNHYDDIYSMDEDTAAHVFKVATRIAKAYKQSLDYEGLNIVQNNGRGSRPDGIPFSYAHHS